MCRNAVESESPARRIEAGKRAAILRLFELLKVKQSQDEATRDLFERMEWQILASVGLDAGSQEWATRAVAGLKEKIRRVSVAEFLVSIYDAHYSASDIEVMVSFFGTPTGQHYLEVQAQVLQESMAAAVRIAKQVAEEIVGGVFAERPDLLPRAPTIN